MPRIKTGDIIHVEWPMEDVRAMWKQIQRNQKEFGYTLGTSMKIGAWHLCRSLGVSTAVAPKHRPVKEIHETPKELKAKGGGKKYEVTSWKSGRKKTFAVRSSNKIRAVRKTRQVRIGNRGLAKATWRASISRYGSKRGISRTGFAPGITKFAKQLVNNKARLKGENPYIRIINRINYIESAMEGGEHAVDTAMERAASGMMKRIDNQIKKKLGVK